VWEEQFIVYRNRVDRDIEKYIQQMNLPEHNNYKYIEDSLTNPDNNYLNSETYVMIDVN
jgi:hypothetical protein